jgi:hypothetical protein
MNRLRIQIIALLLLIGLTSVVQPAPQFYLVAHPSVQADALSREDVRGIYLGYVSRWPDGSDLIPVMQTSGSAQARLLSSVLKKTDQQFKSFWREAIFTGAGLPPKAFATREALLEYVAGTPGALGFAVGDPDSFKVKILNLNE